MPISKRILLPMLAGLAGIFLLAGMYFGIVSLVETPQHAAELFWQDRWIVIPILIAFGLQAALYVILKKRLFILASTTGHSGQLMGASGTTSTMAMATCCAHHVTGRLSFSAQVDGKTVLKDISLLTWTIKNMDVPERVFTWQLFR